MSQDILRQGSIQEQGTVALNNNIGAATMITNLIKTSLGPRGLDKMLVDSLGDVTVTNDGATILKEIDAQHPAAKMLVEISQSTDKEVGDGTTSTVIFAGNLLEKAKPLLDNDVHPTIVVDGYKMASKEALNILDRISKKIPDNDVETLVKIAKTTMQSKLTRSDSDYLSRMVVDTILHIKENNNTVDMTNIKTMTDYGESMDQSRLIKGLIIDKETIDGSIFDMNDVKVVLISSAMEIKKTEAESSLQITNPDQLGAFQAQENKILKEMVQPLIDNGIEIVFCEKGIDDMAQYYLNQAGIKSVKRVRKSDMRSLSRVTGIDILENTLDISDASIGIFENVEEKQVGDSNWVIIDGGEKSKVVTLFLRGGTKRVVDEVERSIVDATMAVRDAVIEPSYVYGCGYSENLVSKELREYSKTVSGLEQLAIDSFADALENYVLILAKSIGLNVLRAKATLREGNFGIDVIKGEIGDVTKLNILDPTLVKKQIIKSATEAACMILRIDENVAIASQNQPQAPPMG